MGSRRQLARPGRRSFHGSSRDLVDGAVALAVGRCGRSRGGVRKRTDAPHFERMERRARSGRRRGRPRDAHGSGDATRGGRKGPCDRRRGECRPVLFGQDFCWSREGSGGAGTSALTSTGPRAFQILSFDRGVLSALASYPRYADPRYSEYSDARVRARTARGDATRRSGLRAARASGGSSGGGDSSGSVYPVDPRSGSGRKSPLVVGRDALSRTCFVAHAARTRRTAGCSSTM